tara:strand:+ start:1124 stop:1315 length:192 start_codon:yes stop_codon:yes gene_type:complete
MGYQVFYLFFLFLSYLILKEEFIKSFKLKLASLILLKGNRKAFSFLIEFVMTYFAEPDYIKYN